MYQCEQCDESFEKWQQKANHVRWHHKENPYTKEGKRHQKEKSKNLLLRGLGFGLKKLLIALSATHLLREKEEIVTRV